MIYFDRIIIGGGIYGLYATLKSIQQGYSVLLLEKEKTLFRRASFINQARVHCGMHYLRAKDTAKECALFYSRFINEHKECINSSFQALYANSAIGSKVTDDDFIKTADSLCINYSIVDPPTCLKKSTIGACIKVHESAFDAKSLCNYYLKNINIFEKRVTIHLNDPVYKIIVKDNAVEINDCYTTNYLLNCSYSNVNNIINLFSTDLYDIKYELCEIAICEVPTCLKNIGLTIMDGPFCSIMPFGFSNYHTLTSVGHTPHYISNEIMPVFPCQVGKKCSPQSLCLCSDCKRLFVSKYDEMNHILKEYLTDEVNIKHYSSLYAVKPILKASEIDDSRPTVIKQHSSQPRIYSVLSGKITTIYELDSIL